MKFDIEIAITNAVFSLARELLDDARRMTMDIIDGKKHEGHPDKIVTRHLRIILALADHGCPEVMTGARPAIDAQVMDAINAPTGGN